MSEDTGIEIQAGIGPITVVITDNNGKITSKELLKLAKDMLEYQMTLATKNKEMFGVTTTPEPEFYT